MVTDPMTAPLTRVDHSTAPFAAFSAQTDPALLAMLVPSTTASEPLPSTSERAGLLMVTPSSLSLHTWLHEVSYTLTVSSSLTPL